MRKRFRKRFPRSGRAFTAFTHSPLIHPALAHSSVAADSSHTGNAQGEIGVRYVCFPVTMLTFAGVATVAWIAILGWLLWSAFAMM
jgi:hypothetical protein